MNATLFDQLSTPSKDKRLKDAILALRKNYLAALKNGSRLRPELQAKLNKIFPSPELSVEDESRRMGFQDITDASSCMVENIKGKYIDLAEAKRRQILGLFSSNPNDEMEYRWGEYNAPSELAASCPVY
jgi:hypothetical protein